ncbi:monovalent cation/H(+) antiporter subunit G [Rhodococcus sp. KRD162]|uniref:monovalent cation/H(+) antiporter subunit G n=1 Tax=unclassified Rhodococcus (in: high G+C Gram-positive bacteria) TaxID=192944 RepID=UPI0019D1CDC5|nr:monovalent cation/H(+) antiporter subunit G [Rhodococcus sp. KRD162]
MSTVTQVIASVFILSGAVMAFTAAVGIVRFPDTLSRMHAATKPQVAGLIMVLIGAIISLRGNVDIWMLLLVGVFTLVTAPVIAHTVGRVAYREQRGRDGLLIVNEREPNDSDR